MTQSIPNAPKNNTRTLNSLNADQPTEEQLLEQFNALQARIAEINLAKVQEQETQRLTAQNDYKQLLAGAEDFRKKALQAISQGKKEHFENQMYQCLDAAQTMRDEFPFLAEAETQAPAPEAGKSPWYTRNHRLLAVLQVIGVITAIWMLKWYFQEYRVSILEDNAKLPDSVPPVSPYDDSSLQKLVFEKLALFTDLPFALIVLTLIVPFVGFYLLPFLKARKDFHTEFYEELTPWQRACITTCFVLGLLLFFALSHQVKP